MRSEEIMLIMGTVYNVLPWIFGIISGFKGGQVSYHWHGVVVELRPHQLNLMFLGSYFSRIECH